MEINELITKYKQIRNESTNSLAKAIGVSTSSLKRIEDGDTKKVDFSLVQQCVKYLKIPMIEVINVLRGGDNSMYISDLIKTKRESKGLSVEEASQLSGLSVLEFEDIEKGKVRDIPFRIVAKLKVTLGFTEEDLKYVFERTYEEFCKIENLSVSKESVKGRCNVCNFDYDLREVNIGRNNQITEFMLCPECRKKLIEQLKESI
ncbi:hypothetical protein BFS06_14510 [Clostridium perfringens]|uniref:Putative transcriptional regulator n=1 Tax=Clostridium perfringens TaxID=1502 RepID=A0A140GRA6_CLOPF|nr:helix-turn-helix transcriptional regulator [Clostridium perfringens]AMN31065.1 putative transcriptional regulator [Clostridium perfringens]TBX14417.1 hypothetical protein BFS06_14510 [Clostridium perfringens]